MVHNGKILICMMNHKETKLSSGNYRLTNTTCMPEITRFEEGLVHTGSDKARHATIYLYGLYMLLSL